MPEKIYDQILASVGAKSYPIIDPIYLSRGAKLVATSPSGRKHLVNISNENGIYTANFEPAEIGEWSISVFENDYEIEGSPFYVFVYKNENKNALVKNSHASPCLKVFPSNPVVRHNERIDLIVDTSGSVGDFRFITDNGDTPCFVRNLGNAIFHVSFVGSNKHEHHEIKAFYDGELIPNKIIVPIINDLRLKGDVPILVEMGSTESFEINTQISAKQKLFVNIIDLLNKKNITKDIIQISPNMFKCNYILDHIGDYKVEIGEIENYKNIFILKSFDASKVKINAHFSKPLLGSILLFTVDASNAGEGTLKMSITDDNTCTNLPIKINKQLQDGSKIFNDLELNDHQSHSIFDGNNKLAGCFNVVFEPVSAGRHHFNVAFNDVIVQSSPFIFDVMEANIPFIKVGEKAELVDEIRDVPISNHEYFLQNTKAIITAPNGNKIIGDITSNPDGQFRLNYNSPFTGRHKIELFFDGKMMPGSPTFVDIFDPLLVKIKHLNRVATVLQPVYLHVITNESGIAPLKMAVINPNGLAEYVQNRCTKDGYVYTFLPKLPGTYTINTTYGSHESKSLSIEVLEDLVTASGPGLQKAIVGNHGNYDDKITGEEENTFFVRTNGLKGSLNVKVESTEGGVSKCNIFPYKNDYIIKYMPNQPGKYKVYILWNDQHIKGSPFMVQASNRLIGDIVGPQLWDDQTISNNLPKMHVLKSINSDHNNINNYDTDYVYKLNSLDRFQMSPNRSPKNTDQSHIFVSNEVRIYGPGLESGKLQNFQGHFFIESPIAVKGLLGLRIKGPKGGFQINVEPYQSTNESSHVLLCSYCPIRTGKYYLFILWAGHQLANSPYCIQLT